MPISSRFRLVSPRLRGLFDLRGPGQANFDATQSCLDYSPETQVEVVDICGDPVHSDEWVDDDNEVTLLSDSGSPFDDKYALPLSPRKVEKRLPALPREGTDKVFKSESKIPRNAHVRRRTSSKKNLAGRAVRATHRIGVD